MPRHTGLALLGLLAVALAGAVGWRALAGADEAAAGPGGAAPAFAVEVAPVESGAVVERRELSGALEARARFVVAPKVGGRLDAVLVDLGDPIRRGQVVARLDDDELAQEVLRAEAALALADAALLRAESDRDLAQRDSDRTASLREQGIASASQQEELAARLAGAKAAVAVSRAEVEAARAELEIARIRRGYAELRAEWSGEDEERVVGERFEDAGNTVSAGDAVLSVVALDPLLAVVSVTERDYGALAIGQEAEVRTDARPGQAFRGVVARISPVFRVASRQARVELLVDNPEGLLKPGQFARVRIELRTLEADTVVPVEALARRGEESVLFVLDDAPDDAGATVVRRVPVRVVATGGGRAAVTAVDPSQRVAGRVVTLGQDLLDDGAPVNVVEPAAPATQP